MGNRLGNRHRIYGSIEARILVRYKKGVPDPEKAALLSQFHENGFDQITNADRAKYFQVKFPQTTLRKARAEAKKVAKVLLANQTIECFEILSVTIPSPS